MGSFKFSVASTCVSGPPVPSTGMLHTFKMEKNVGLVVLEHLGNKLNIHVLDVDFLSTVRSRSENREVCVLVSSYS